MGGTASSPTGEQAGADAGGGHRPVPARFRRARGDRRGAGGPPGAGAGLETHSRHRVAGRIVARRGHGKACFLDLRDGSGQIQLHAREDLLGEEPFRLLVDLDLGDMIGVEGTAMATRSGGELSAGDRPLAAAGEEPATAARQVPRPRGRRDPLPPARARPARQRGQPPDLRPARPGRSPRSGAGSTSTASSRPRRRSCSRSTAAPWRARSSPTTTRSTATSTCGSRPSST